MKYYFVQIAVAYSVSHPAGTFYAVKSVFDSLFDYKSALLWVFNSNSVDEILCRV